MIRSDIFKVGLVPIIRHTKKFSNVTRLEVEIRTIYLCHVVPLIHHVQGVIELWNLRKHHIGLWDSPQCQYPFLCLDELLKANMVLI